MAKIKLGLSKRSIENKIQFGTDVDSAMRNAGGGATFAGLAAGQGAMTTSKTSLQTKWTEFNAAQQMVQQKSTELNGAEADFDNEMTHLANDVENLANGDVGIIQSAGMDVKNPPSPPQVPSQVINLIVSEGSSSGKINLAWKKAQYAKSYTIEITTDVDNPSSWSIKTTSIKTKFTVNGLTSGTKYWFRVYGVSSVGDGAPSDPAVKYAP